MGVYIRGMKMPGGCASCKIKRRNGKKMICPLCGEEWDIHDPMSADHTLDNCPLVPVQPHDRLIEYHAAVHAVYDGYKEFGLTWRNAEVMLGKLPTIIPAEEATP